jgi:hypothetical protein
MTFTEALRPTRPNIELNDLQNDLLRWMKLHLRLSQRVLQDNDIAAPILGRDYRQLYHLYNSSWIWARFVCMQTFVIDLHSYWCKLFETQTDRKLQWPHRWCHE